MERKRRMAKVAFVAFLFYYMLFGIMTCLHRFSHVELHSCSQQTVQLELLGQSYDSTIRADVHCDFCSLLHYYHWIYISVDTASSIFLHATYFSYPPLDYEWVYLFKIALPSRAPPVLFYT